MTFAEIVASTIACKHGFFTLFVITGVVVVPGEGGAVGLVGQGGGGGALPLPPVGGAATSMTNRPLETDAVAVVFEDVGVHGAGGPNELPLSPPTPPVEVGGVSPPPHSTSYPISVDVHP